jgi:hypothetical protein
MRGHGVCRRIRSEQFSKPLIVPWDYTALSQYRQKNSVEMEAQEANENTGAFDM